MCGVCQTGLMTLSSRNKTLPAQTEFKSALRAMLDRSTWILSYVFFLSLVVWFCCVLRGVFNFKLLKESFKKPNAG